MTLGGPPANADLDAKRLSTQTLADGSFELRGAAPGDWELTATHPDHVDSPPLALTLAAGQSQRDLVVKLEPAGLVVGHVTEADGTPSADIEVTVTPAAAASAPSDPQDVTATIGRMLQVDDGQRAPLRAHRIGRQLPRRRPRRRQLRRRARQQLAAWPLLRPRRDDVRAGRWRRFERAAWPEREGRGGPGVARPTSCGRGRGSVTGHVVAGGRPVPDQPVTMRKSPEPGAFSLPGFGGGRGAHRRSRRLHLQRRRGRRLRPVHAGSGRGARADGCTSSSSPAMRAARTWSSAAPR